jgi:cation diffusion facilitator CzcD-associated flavoprotein CzcO
MITSIRRSGQDDEPVHNALRQEPVMIGKDSRILVIGAGPGGIISAYQFRQAGYTNVKVLERDGDVGGTWQRSRYPGLSCDVMIHAYSFSFNLNPSWPRSYASQPEILDYMRATVDKLDLWPMIHLNTGVTGATWHDDSAEWVVTTTTGETLVADVVISAQGMFGEVKLPDIAGRGTFAGTLIHTGEWPHDLEIANKRVAVIGSAASAVQSIPEIAKVASHLTSFQRSPQGVLPKEEFPIPAEQIEEFTQNPEALQGYRDAIMNYIGPNAPFSNKEILGGAEWAGAVAISGVEDPTTREGLTPHVPWGCFRPLFSNDYYPAFNRPNVELVTAGIERITPKGIVTADGVEREFDVIVCATGYVVDKFAARIPVTGRDGRSLDDEWADGPEAYLGVTSTGFPNLFMLYGPNNNAGSLIQMAEYEVGYVLELLDQMNKADADWIDVRRENMNAYNSELQAAIAGVEVWHAGCGHYYESPSGKIVTQYPFSMFHYRDSVANPDLSPFELGRK